MLIRERHIGDVQDPITTRTSGVGSSARSLVYEDGVLVSALIGNNNTNASPRWDLVSPDEVERTDILYGPFSAAYPGNSIGEVVQITTRTATHFEASGTIEGACQGFSQYGTDQTFPAGRISGTIGDRVGKLSFWLSALHLDSESQPLYDVTAATPASPSAAGTPVTGAFAALNRTGRPVQVLGAGGLEHQVEDSANLKLAYDFTPAITGIYSVGFFRDIDNAGVQSDLRNGAGATVYNGSLNIAGYDYSVPQAPSIAICIGSRKIILPRASPCARARAGRSTGSSSPASISTWWTSSAIRRRPWQHPMRVGRGRSRP